MSCARQSLEQRVQFWCIVYFSCFEKGSLSLLQWRTTVQAGETMVDNLASQRDFTNRTYITLGILQEPISRCSVRRAVFRWMLGWRRDDLLLKIRKSLLYTRQSWMDCIKQRLMALLMALLGPVAKGPSGAATSTSAGSIGE